MTTSKPAKQYLAAVGKRKTAIARVRLTPSDRLAITINDRDFKTYFPTDHLRELAEAPFKKAGLTPKFTVSVKVQGGGIHAQAEAVGHGIARTLLLHDGALRVNLKQAGLLRRDARIKERRKFGLKKARKAPQWSKR